MPFLLSSCFLDQTLLQQWAALLFFSIFLSSRCSREPSIMLNLNFFTAAAAAFTLVSGVNAGGYPVNMMRRNQEPSQPSCTNFTPFKYAGCFKDLSSPRALLYTGPSTQNMTVETCVAFCKGMPTTNLTFQ